MMKTKVIIVTGLSILCLNAQASVDWTPYLKPMQNGCEDLAIRENFPKSLPKVYQKAITATKFKGNLNLEKGDQQYSYTYYLKDSVAFGKPITAIQMLYGYEWGHTEVFFKDSSFVALRPQFKLPKPDPENPESINKNDATGWEVGYSSLTFDKKSKSIMCFTGV